MAKNAPASAGDAEDSGSILGWVDPLEEEMATLSSILAWRIPWTEEPGRLQSLRLQRVRYDQATERTHACIDTEDETFLVDGALGWGRRAAEGKKGPYIFHPLRSDAPTTHPFEFNPFKELGSSVLSPLASQFLSSLSSVPLLPTRVLGLLNQ